MRVLVTSARFPHAVAEVRKFGSEGHEVYAADTFWTSPGIHSRYVREALITAAPALDPARFVSDVARIVRDKRIDLVVPAFEEALYLARDRAELPASAELFCPSFDTLAQLHNKASFAELGRAIGLDVPRTTVVHGLDELRAALRDFDCYCARPVYSRGGTVVLTNVGPLAGARAVETCDPTAGRPWLVQEFVRGTDVCTFSVAQYGRVAAHGAYEHPAQIDHGGGIAFVSVDAAESLPVVQRVVAATRYHGQISLDLRRTPDGRLVLIECNPRPTAGLCLMPARDLVDAVVRVPARGARPTLVPAGRREQIAAALVRDMLRDWRSIPADVAMLVNGGEDVYLQRDDMLPGLFQVLSYTHVRSYRRHVGRRKARSSDLVESQFYDIAWNGEDER